jgi:anthranilate synthase component 1
MQGPAPEEHFDTETAAGLVFTPDFDTFRRLAANYTVVPVWCEVLGDLDTPVSAFQKLRSARSFLLESVVRGERWGRFSFLGFDPEFVIVTKDRALRVEGNPLIDLPSEGDPIEAVETLLGCHSAPRLPGLPPLHAGLVGYWAYECVRFMDRVPVTNPDDLGVPDMLLYATGTLVAFDHLRQRFMLIRNVYVRDSQDTALYGAYSDAVEALGRVAEKLTRPITERPQSPRIPVHMVEAESNMSPQQWTAMIKAAREYILAGDVFQVVLSQRFTQPISVDPFEVHRSLRLVNPSPYMTYIEHPEVTIVCGSPEQLVRFEDGRVHERPIAGTRWRGTTEAEDEALAADLLTDDKELAEHVMLVDLARNDVGRVCEYGTVRVGDFKVIEQYSHVMHIVSSVTGKARPGVKPMDVLRATFPAGTVSGAPKVRAMEIINELESARRGPYAGVVGYVDFSGNLDTAITLRTAVLRDGKAHVQAGSGIVADSDPDYELNESRNKAKAVLVALAAAQARTGTSE